MIGFAVGLFVFYGAAALSMAGRPGLDVVDHVGLTFGSIALGVAACIFTNLLDRVGKS